MIIKVLAGFTKDEYSEDIANSLIDKGTSIHDVTDWEDFYLNTEHLVAFNKSSHKNITTIRLINGESWLVKMGIEEFAQTLREAGVRVYVKY